MVVANSMGKIRILHFNNPNIQNTYVPTWKNAPTLNFSKYSIKETDLRIKTATFSSPDYIDLTTGLYAILISSKFHENFSGIVLDVEYDPSTGLYNYQCQDWSRTYMAKSERITSGNYTLYDNLLIYLTRLELFNEHVYRYEQRKKKNKNAKDSYTFSASEKAKYKHALSGVRALWKYDQSIYEGNKYKGNPFKKKVKFISRGKTHIENIRNLVFSQLGYFDVWFNDRGILQVEPLSKTDWEQTGLHVTTPQMASQKYKFSTTNAITRVLVEGTGTEAGTAYGTPSLGKELDLTIFFGWQGASISDPTKKDANVSNATKKTTTTTTVNSNNPYGTKNKEVWVNMDDVGSRSQDLNYLSKVCDLLKQNGWKVHNMGRGPNIHSSESQFSQCRNGIWWTIDGGMDPGTIRHLGYDSWCAGSIMKRGGRCVFACMMDNPKTYWVEKGCGNWYDLGKAWDDRYSSGDTYLKYPAGYMAWSGLPFMTAKNHDAKGMVAQFLKGGCSQEALKMSNWKNHKGNYYVRSGWTSKY